MEQDPNGPQTPNWHQDVGPAKVSGGHRPFQAFLWLVVIALLGLIFWHFVPRSEVQVSYAPWFLQQVAADNIQSLSIQGVEARGVLRHEQTYQGPTSRAVPVRRFLIYFPSEASIEPIIQKLASPREVGSPPVLIETSPPASNAGGWIMLLLPMFVVLGLVYLMTRQARDRLDRSR